MKKFAVINTRFAEFRLDKKTADTLAQIQDQFDNAVKA